MKLRNILFLLLVLLTNIGCKKTLFDGDPKNTPQNNFMIFWNDFSKYYPVFQLNSINWDSVYSVNYPIITPRTTDYELFNILKSCILTLKDRHSNIYSNQFGNDGYSNLFIKQKPKNFISWSIISSKYVQVIKSNNNDLAYGQIRKQDIGYFFIGAFDNKQDDYYLIDEFISTFQHSKGIIIDIRQNGGGNSSNSEIIASRLTSEPVAYMYQRYRNGPMYSDLSDFYPFTVNPGGKIKFTKPVVLLTNRRTFSAAEDFTLMLRNLPNVIHIGDTTGGGVGSNPITKPLPNGWSYRMSRSINYDISKKPIKNGIAPQVSINISKADSIQGIDRIMEEAINIINEK